MAVPVGQPVGGPASRTAATAATRRAYSGGPRTGTPEEGIDRTFPLYTGLSQICVTAKHEELHDLLIGRGTGGGQ